jgi:hypothetical protein
MFSNNLNIKGMKTRNQLKIFNKTSIDFLKKIYIGMSYVFTQNSWKSARAGNYWDSRIFGIPDAQFKRIGNELKIFKVPSIAGLKITYYKCIAFVFDKNHLVHQIASGSEENFLLRDLSSSAQNSNEKELKIFKFLNIDKLEKLSFKKKTERLKD